MADQFASAFHEELAPIAGQISVLTVNTTAASQDLSLCGPQTSSMANASILPTNATTAPGLLQRRVSFTAVTANVGLLFGANLAAVSNANAPNIANTGVDTATCCYLLPAGVEKVFIIHNETQCVGYVGSGNGSLVICSKSRVV